MAEVDGRSRDARNLRLGRRPYQSLSGLFVEKQGRVVDKWEQYLWAYEQEFAPYLNEGRQVRLLELGVQNGGSLELWANYFSEGSEIFGIDIAPEVADLRFKSDKIKTFVLDVNDREGVRDALGNQTFDIIIDDASHICADVKSAFGTFFDYLAPGGKFFIEDLHASYFPSHGGGFRTPDSSIEFLKGLVDALNCDHWKDVEILSEAEDIQLRRLSRFIKRITFFDSLAVIDKLSEERFVPYRRVISGLHADVVPLGDWLPSANLQSLSMFLFAHPAVRQVEAILLQELSKSQSALESLRSDYAKLPPETVGLELDQLRRVASERGERLGDLETALQRGERQLLRTQRRVTNMRIASNATLGQLRNSLIGAERQCIDLEAQLSHRQGTLDHLQVALNTAEQRNSELEMNTGILLAERDAIIDHLRTALDAAEEQLREPDPDIAAVDEDAHTVFAGISQYDAHGLG